MIAFFNKNTKWIMLFLEASYHTAEDVSYITGDITLIGWLNDVCQIFPLLSLIFPNVGK